MLEAGEFDNFTKERYKDFNEGIGKEIVEDKADFETLEKYALNHCDITNK